MERGSHDHRHQEEEGGCKMTKRSAHSLSLATSWLLLKNSWRNAKRHTSSLICTHTHTCSNRRAGEETRGSRWREGKREKWMSLLESCARTLACDAFLGRQCERQMCASGAGTPLHSNPHRNSFPSSSSRFRSRLSSSTLIYPGISQERGM